MRNPPRTLQNSIFEPLYSHQEELHFQHNMPNTQSSSSSSFSPSFSIAPPSTQVTMKRAAASILNDNTPGKASSSDVTATEFARSVTATTEYAHTQHGVPATCELGMFSPSGAITPTSAPICPPIRSHSTSDVGNPDDGSVASKLLNSSITKSISSPSLLACCKEAARETPYQKSLRLRTMKLQYCAEELGSESSEGSLHGGDYFNSNIFDSLNRMSSSQTPREYQKSEGNNCAKLISVRSSPNLGCSSLVSLKPTSHVKERSFPPPLSHTLPRSASLDSFSYSLRASREDGRFVLKEFKVPCRQYFQASRKDGRLTLQRLTSTDEDLESMPNIDDEAHIDQQTDLQEDDNVGVYIEASRDVGGSEKVEVQSAKGGSTDKGEVESAKNTANLGGGLEVCRVKGRKKSVDNNADVKEPESLFMATTFSNGDSSCAKIIINEKAKYLSLGAANCSKMQSDFKSAKRKTTNKASCIRSSSSRHLRVGSSNRLSLVHLPAGNSRSNSKLGHDSDTIKFTQCAENLRLESKSTSGISTGRGKTLQEFVDTVPTSLQTAGYGIGNSPSSMIIFKDHGSAKLVMEEVRKLVASCGLEYGGERSLDKSSYKNSGKGSKSINMREVGSSCSHEWVLFDVKSCDRSFLHCGEFREGECDVVDDSTRSCLSSSSLHNSNVEIPPSSCSDSRGAPLLPMQGTEWPHSLHCKEIFHRNLPKGAFMKLHCVA